MGKIVDGMELLIMIENEELKNKKVYIQEIYYDSDTHKEKINKKNIVIDKFGYIFVDKDMEEIKDINIFRKLKFYIEDNDEETDIDSIEELNTLVETTSEKIEANTVRKKVNEVIKAVKQLNKKLEEK